MEKIQQNLDGEFEHKIKDIFEQAQDLIKYVFGLELTNLELAGLKKIAKDVVAHDQVASDSHKTNGHPEVVVRFMSEYYDIDVEMVLQFLYPKTNDSTIDEKIRDYFKRIQDERHHI